MAAAVAAAAAEDDDSGPVAVYCDAGRGEAEHVQALNEVLQALSATASPAGMTLFTLVTRLQPWLTHAEDAKARERATLLLAQCLDRLPDMPLTTNATGVAGGDARGVAEAQAVLHYADFFLARLTDAPASVPALMGLLALLRTRCVSATDAAAVHARTELHVPRKVVDTVLGELHVPSLMQVIRHRVFEIVTLCLTEPLLLEDVHPLGDGFVAAVLEAVENEKDPRCVLQVLCIIPLLVHGFPSLVAPFAEHIFDVSGCYFPIVFTPPPNDPYGITTEMLTTALQEALCSHVLIVDFTVPLLIEKLSSSAAGNAKTDALDMLILATQRYGQRALSRHTQRLSETLQHELLASTTPELTLRLLDTIAELACASVTPQGDGWDDFGKPLLDWAAAEIRQNAESVLGRTAGRVLDALSRKCVFALRQALITLAERIISLCGNDAGDVGGDNGGDGGEQQQQQQQQQQTVSSALLLLLSKLVYRVDPAADFATSGDGPLLHRVGEPLLRALTGLASGAENQAAAAKDDADDAADFSVRLNAIHAAVLVVLRGHMQHLELATAVTLCASGLVLAATEKDPGLLRRACQTVVLLCNGDEEKEKEVDEKLAQPPVVTVLDACVLPLLTRVMDAVRLAEAEPSSSMPTGTRNALDALAQLSQCASVHEPVSRELFSALQAATHTLRGLDAPDSRTPVSPIAEGIMDVIFACAVCNSPAPGGAPNRPAYLLQPADVDTDADTQKQPDRPRQLQSGLDMLLHCADGLLVKMRLHPNDQSAAASAHPAQDRALLAVLDRIAALVGTLITEACSTAADASGDLPPLQQTLAFAGVVASPEVAARSQTEAFVLVPFLARTLLAVPASYSALWGDKAFTESVLTHVLSGLHALSGLEDVLAGSALGGGAARQSGFSMSALVQAHCVCVAAVLNRCGPGPHLEALFARVKDCVLIPTLRDEVATNNASTTAAVAALRPHQVPMVELFLATIRASLMRADHTMRAWAVDQLREAILSPILVAPTRESTAEAAAAAAAAAAGHVAPQTALEAVVADPDPIACSLALLVGAGMSTVLHGSDYETTTQSSDLIAPMAARGRLSFLWNQRLFAELRAVLEGALLFARHARQARRARAAAATTCGAATTAPGSVSTKVAPARHNDEETQADGGGDGCTGEDDRHAETGALLCLLHLASSVPVSVLEQNTRGLLAAAVMAITSSLPILRIAAARSLWTMLNERVEFAEPHLSVLVPNLLDLTRYAGAASVRLTALQCLLKLVALPYRKLHPVKNDVIKGLVAALDDRKRAVRQLAAKTRNEWSVLAS